MKKIIFTIFILTMVFSSVNNIFAIENQYEFLMNYEGNIVENVEKSGTVTLKGVDAPVHQNVRIKVDLNGPATPKILATDSLGKEHDIASIGYWGPESGFAVGGTFTNNTPIKATYPKAGTYTTTLTLIDAKNPTVEYAKKHLP